MDNMKIRIILVLTCIIIIGTTCIAATGLVNAPSGLVLRETADKNSKPLTTISDESKVEIIEKSGEWYKVKYEDYEGYLFAEYVNVQEEVEEETETEDTDVNTEETNSADTSVSNYPTNVTTTSSIKAYLIPSYTSKVVLEIEEDKEITINYELNNWYNISLEGKTYWVRKANIKIENTETSEENSTGANRTAYIDVSSAANIREKPDTSSKIRTTLLRNAQVTIIGEEGDFYKIRYNNTTGYVSKSLVSDTEVEVTSRTGSGERTTPTSYEIRPAEEPTQNTTSNSSSESSSSTPREAQPVPQGSSGGAQIAEYAQQYIGYSYTYGGTTPSGGFDCSGFAQYVCRECGYSIGRTCSNQLNDGYEVSRDELQAGDLIFFNNTSNGSVGHVGIYIGGDSIVHAANSRRGVTTDTIASGYYNNYYMTARRVAY